MRSIEAVWFGLELLKLTKSIGLIRWPRMIETLFAWLSHEDLKAADESPEAADGPTAWAMAEGEWDRAVILSNLDADRTNRYVQWLEKWTPTIVEVRFVQLSSPTDYAQIFKHANHAVSENLKKGDDEKGMTFHLSSGSSAMVAIWVMLAKTRYPKARLIESFAQQKIQNVVIPFEISVDFLPDLFDQQDKHLVQLLQGLPSEAPEFDHLVYRDSAMKSVVAMARRAAPRNLPVLIQGESGTGKELLAQAIHHASRRNNGPFIAVNCGAIAENLVESELFGHEKGAFTGAMSQRAGHFETARGGTIFLDEVGDLPLSVQVKLLRVLQEQSCTAVGSSHARSVDVRIITATNRNLLEEVAKGRFRHDLFHRIAVVMLNLPPLRDRKGDINAIVDQLIASINHEFSKELGYIPKNLSESARNLILSHRWPGNIRELLNTLSRATLWANGATIKAKDIEFSLLPSCLSDSDELLNRPLTDGFSLPKVLSEVANHYMARALQDANQNRAKAARLLGLPNTTTFGNWLKKHPWTFKSKE